MVSGSSLCSLREAGSREVKVVCSVGQKLLGAIDGFPCIGWNFKVPTESLCTEDLGKRQWLSWGCQEGSPWVGG